MFYLNILSLFFIIYYLRYSIYYYYCRLYTFFEKQKKIKQPHQRSEIFNINTFEITTINHSNINHSNIKNDDTNFKIVLLTENNVYQICPNENTAIQDNIFFICEIYYNDNCYDITTYLKQFYIKNNIILDRRFITYILYKYFNIELKNDEKYTIQYIDKNITKQNIVENIETFKYLI